MDTRRKNRVTKKKRGGWVKSATKSAPIKSKSVTKSAPIKSKSAPILPYSHESTNSLRYGPMSDSESEIRLDNITPSSKGYVTLTNKNHDQEKPYLIQLIESSGVDRKKFIKFLKYLNGQNIERIHKFFKGNFKVPDKGEQYNTMIDLLEDPRINDLVCEAALMKE